MDWPGLQPYLAASGGSISLGIALDWRSNSEPAQKFDHLFAVDQPTTRKPDIHQPDNLPPGCCLRPLPQIGQPPGYIGRSDQRADRGPADDVGLNSDGADMRPSAGRAAPECEPEPRKGSTFPFMATKQTCGLRCAMSRLQRENSDHTLRNKRVLSRFFSCQWPLS